MNDRNASPEVPVSALAVGASGVFNRSPHPATLRENRTRRESQEYFQDNPLHMGAWDYSTEASERNLQTPLLASPRQESAGSGSVKMAAVYGVINTIITVPSQIGFALIIYSDPFFSDPNHDNYMPMLLKLVLFSSAVHQLVFVCLSSLPFAVAQVQDAGLIFLSSMASAIVAAMLSQGQDADDTVSTVVVSLSLSTAVLGIMLVITGKLRLAGLVQYLPLPVVGGYLAFIGLYCGQAGVQLMAGVNGVSGFLGWKEFFFNGHNLLLMSPGVASSMVLVYVTKYVKHNLALPACLMLLPTLFYIVLLVSGTSLDEARDGGWVSKPSGDTRPFYEMYSLFDFSKVHWSAAFPQILPTFFAMYCVVAFGSCLDVAAIQYDSGRGLDFDHELKTVGWSNVVSGALGGYTGSYIFSQTLFSLRNGVSSRVNGLFVVITETILVLLPYEIVAFVPKFYFGSVMLFISFDLLFDWLVHSYHKVDFREYLLVWSTFIAISYTSLEVGMAIGVVFAALNFVYSYSQTSSVEVIGARSSMVRGYADRKLLARERDAIVTVRLHGYQFFGTTIQVTEAIQSRVTVEVEVEDEEANVLEQGEAGTSRGDDENMGIGGIQLAQDLLGRDQNNITAIAEEEEEGPQPRLARRSSSGSSRRRKVLKRLVSSEGSDSSSVTKRVTVKNLLGISLTPNLKRFSANYTSGQTPAASLFGRWRRKRAAPKQAHLDPARPAMVRTRYVVLDCTNVSAIDATSARSCFLTLRQILESHGIRMIFANLPASSRRLLLAHGVLVHDTAVDPPQDVMVYGAHTRSRRQSGTQEEADREPSVSGSQGDCAPGLSALHHFPIAFDSLDDALEWCEDQVLARVKGLEPPIGQVHADGVGAASRQIPTSVLQGFLYGSEDASISESLVERVSQYFERVPNLENNTVLFDVGDSSDYLYFVESGHVKLYALNPHVEGIQWSGIERKHQLSYAGGGLVGELDFFLNRPRSLCAVVYSPPQVILNRLSRASYERMKEDLPEFAVKFQESLLNSFALSSSTIVRLGD